jgi:hypothetical protein
VRKTFMPPPLKTKPTFGLFCSCENKVKQLDKTRSKRFFFHKKHNVFSAVSIIDWHLP